MASVVRVPNRLTFQVNEQPAPLNPLENFIYVKLGESEIFRVRPIVVHFGGYEVGKKHVQVVHVTNISGQSQRLHLLSPSTDFFKVRCQKKGSIAPGMSEDIIIEFVPTEWRYYYDHLRIHAKEENLLIPIHAYPFVNEVIFPGRIDFGKCPLSQTSEKKIRLQCKVPIQFEFQFTVEKSHTDITVFPEKGIIPAEGFVEIFVQYRPTTQTSAEAHVQLTLSQFQFQPILCTITGVGFPGIARSTVIREIEEAIVSEANTLSPAHPLVLSATHPMSGLVDMLARAKGQAPAGFLESYEEHAGTGPTRGGAGNGDPYTRHLMRQSLMDRVAGKTKTVSPKTKQIEEAQEKVIDGISFPARLDNQHATNYIMTQEPGKLRIKDLITIIEKQKIASKEKAEKGEAEEEDDVTMSRQMREAQFTLFITEVANRKREMDIKFFEFIGKPLMTDAEKNEIIDSRNRTTERIARHARDLARARQSMELVGRRAIVDKTFVETHTPTYDVFLNNEFEARGNVIDRFLRACMKCIYQNRAIRRAAVLKEWLAPANGDRKVVAQMVEQENSLADAPSSGDSNMTVVTTIRLSGDNFKQSFLNWREGDGGGSGYKPCEPVSVPSFVDLEPLPLKVQRHATAMDYQPYSLTPAMSCVRTAKTRKLRTGVEDENAVAAPRGKKKPESELELPEALRCCVPVAPFEVINSMPHVRDYTPMIPMAETVPQYFLQAFSRSTNFLRRPEMFEPSALTSSGKMATLESLYVQSDEHTTREAGGGDWELPLPGLLTGPCEDDDMLDVSAVELEEHPVKLTRDIPTVESMREEFFLPGYEPIPAPEGEGDGEGEGVTTIPTEATHVLDLPLRMRLQESETMNRKMRETWAASTKDAIVSVNEHMRDPANLLSLS